jgi:hypothetical protein
MNFEQMILINKFGQNIINYDVIVELFNTLSLDKKKIFLNNLTFLIMQSKAEEKDISNAIEISNLKPTYTPCVIVRKGLSNANLNKIIELPETELEKSLILFLNIFKIAYTRRFFLEKNSPSKWWYWDLSSEENLSRILRINKL